MRERLRPPLVRPGPDGHAGSRRPAARRVRRSM